MKVAVLNNWVPFLHGGAEELCDHLVRNLVLAGHQAEAVRIPFSWNPPDRLVDEMVIARSLRLPSVDRVIALKFPVYMAPHQDKVVWLLHQYRQAYDLWDAGQSNIPATPHGERLRAIIRQADNAAFAESRQIYTNSPTTSRRLSHYNGVESTVLPPPLNDPHLFGRDSADEGYILAGGRVNASKRQLLLVQALRHAPEVRLVVAGPPDTPADATALQRAVEEAGVGDRVRLDLRFLPREELATLVNRARAVAYVPVDEDSMGYVTMEAFEARKPVLTVSDSGGLLQVVKDRRTGRVVPPDASSLGEAMAWLTSDPARARALGEDGHDLFASFNLTWPSTVERLLS